MATSPKDKRKQQRAALPEMRLFRYFVALEAYGSISNAANCLGVSQPYLSDFIKNLEEELRTKLVIRTQHGVELTDAGAILARNGAEILDKANVAITSARNLGRQPSGHVAIAMTASIVALIAVPLTETIQHEFGAKSIYVVETNSMTMIENIRAGQLDFGIGYQDHDLMGGLYGRPIMEEDLFLLAAPDDWPVPADDLGIAIEPVELADLYDRPLILPHKSSAWRRSFDQAAQRVGLHIPPAFEIDSMSSMLSLVRRASAFGIAPHSTAYLEAARGEVICVPIANPRIAVRSYIMRKQGTPASQFSLMAQDLAIKVLSEVIERYRLCADIL